MQRPFERDSIAPAHPLWERKWGTPLVLEATSLVLGLLVATEALSVRR